MLTPHYSPGLHSGAVIFNVTSQQEGSGFKPAGQLGHFYVKFLCYPCVCMCSVLVLWLPPKVQRRASYVNWQLCIVHECEWLFFSMLAL